MEREIQHWSARKGKLSQSNFRKMAGDFRLNTQIHEALETSGRKLKTKRKILKAVDRKVTFKGTTVKNTTDFSTEQWKLREGTVESIFNGLKENRCQPRVPYQ